MIKVKNEKIKMLNEQIKSYKILNPNQSNQLTKR